MAHRGRIIALGGAGESCADALWQGEVWVAGPVESLGAKNSLVRQRPWKVVGGNDSSKV